MEGGLLGDGWYFTREDIEKFSPSRKHGIDAKRENNLRKSYCSFIREVGVRLKLPQVAIATAIVFCHRFYLRQSHYDHDRYTIATACVFLSGKVEENPKSLMTVIQLAYEIRHKRDPNAKERIKEKEVYVPQKELTVMAERVVLSTLAYDLNVQHPYKFIVSAIKIFKVSESSLAQVAWNFVNDGLITTLCLQYKPQHIAAGALFLGAKFLKVTLPSNEKPWWQEFDVNPRQLEDVSNQMLELYEQSKTIAASASNDISSSQGQTTDVPTTTMIYNTNTRTNGIVGHDNQGLAIPKSVRSRTVADAKEHGYLTSTTVQVDSHEIMNDTYLKMRSAAASGATSLVGTVRLGNKGFLEQTCFEQTDCAEERKRKKSRWDAGVGEASSVTSVDEQVQPTIRGMVLK